MVIRCGLRHEVVDWNKTGPHGPHAQYIERKNELQVVHPLFKQVSATTSSSCTNVDEWKHDMVSEAPPPSCAISPLYNLGAVCCMCKVQRALGMKRRRSRYQTHKVCDTGS